MRFGTLNFAFAVLLLVGCGNNAPAPDSEPGPPIFTDKDFASDDEMLKGEVAIVELGRDPFAPPEDVRLAAVVEEPPHNMTRVPVTGPHRASPSVRSRPATVGAAVDAAEPERIETEWPAIRFKGAIGGDGNWTAVTDRGRLQAGEWLTRDVKVASITSGSMDLEHRSGDRFRVAME